MRKYRFSFLVITAYMICWMFCPDIRAEESEEQEEPKLNVSVLGSVTVVPDVAYVMSGVSSQAPLAEDALKENQETVQKVLEAIKKSGISKDSVLLAGSNIATASRRIMGEGEQRVGFKVFTRIVVKVANNEKEIAALVDQMTKAGANVFGGESSDFSSRRLKAVIYMLQDDSKAKEEALKKANAKVRPEAEMLAKSMGIKLGEIQNIHLLRSDRDQVIFSPDEKEDGLPEGSKSTNSKTIEVKARISASYLIKK